MGGRDGRAGLGRDLDGLRRYSLEWISEGFGKKRTGNNGRDKEVEHNGKKELESDGKCVGYRGLLEARRGGHEGQTRKGRMGYGMEVWARGHWD